MKALILAAKFALELLALAVFGFFGYRIGVGDAVATAALAIAIPLGAAVLWGTFAAPLSTRRLRDPQRFVFETAFFALAGSALAVLGHTADGCIFFLAFVLNEALLRKTAQES